MKRALPFLILAALMLVAALTFGYDKKISLYGAAVFTLLAIKMILSARRKKWVPTDTQQENLDGLKIALVVPIYNEDPILFQRLLYGLDNQTRKPDEIWLIDDGSHTTACIDAGHLYSFMRSDVHVHQIKHGGKRDALGYAFQRSDADLFITVDSDTILDPNAIQEGIKPFIDEKVMAVTGLILASNRTKNVLTRLIDIRYANAFLYERAAYSTLGAVLCTCGSFAVYRSTLVKKYLKDFLEQKFLGRSAVFGDDRRLTNYALLEGKVILQETARAYTAVPERMSHYLNQQIRWNKSFARESLWALRHQPARRWAFWLTLIEVLSWTVFGTALLYAVYVRPFHSGKIEIIGYIIFAALMAYVRSIRYLEARTDLPLAVRIRSFALAPLYGLMHITVLMPLRVYAMVTVRSNGWRTRKKVEVSA